MVTMVHSLRGDDVKECITIKVRESVATKGKAKLQGSQMVSALKDPVVSYNSKPCAQASYNLTLARVRQIKSQTCIGFASWALI